MKEKGLKVILGMGPPPKLGTRTTSPRPTSSKTYRGSSGVDVGEPEEPDPSEENAFESDKEEEPDEMLVGAAHDVMTAFHARDPEGVAAALKAFISMC